MESCLSSTASEVCGKQKLFCETPLIESLPLQKIVGLPVYLKLENAQPTGSFKLRGLNDLCQEAVQNGCTELVSSSGGNAGIAIAYIARKLGVHAKIVIPSTSPLILREKLKEQGAEIEVHGNWFNEANEKALILSQKPGSFYVHPFDHPSVWRSNATLIEEIAAQLPTAPSVVITCVGGGGLLCGILEGLHLVGWQNVPVIAMETFGAESFNASVKAGHIVVLPAITSIAKTLGSVVVCEKLMDYIKIHTIFSEVVHDKEAISACLKFADDHRILVEPSCGAALSGIYNGILSQMLKEKKICGDGPVVVIVCGGCGVSLAMLDDWKKQFNL